MQSINNNQLIKAQEVLRGLAENVSLEDKKAAIAAGIVQRTMVYQYLAGKGNDLDTAAKLIRFFKRRIEKREKLIA
jgi:uncharacterized protein (UPF0335 family)